MGSSIRLKDQITKQIQTSLRKGRFEVKKGNTLATLAMVMNTNHRSIYGHSKNVLYDSQSFETNTGGPDSFMNTTCTYREPLVIYVVQAQIVHTLIPFYTYFFEYYRDTQKLHVLRFLANHQIYDEGLFKNFIDNLESVFYKFGKSKKVED
jgi:hypothetical protein